MASQSLAALLEDAGSKVEPRLNGETEAASLTPGDSVPEDERALCPVSTDVSLDSSSPKGTTTSPHAAPTSDAQNTAHIPVFHPVHTAPLEEVQKGETAMEGIDVVENIQDPLSPDNAMAISMPSTAAVITDTIEPDSTLSTAVISAEPTRAVDATEASTPPSTVGVATDCTDGATVPPAEATVDLSTIGSTAATSMPSTEAVVIDSDMITDSVAVATTDSTVVAASDSTAPLIVDSVAPIITDSAIIEPTLTNPVPSIQVTSSASSKSGIDAPAEELNRTAAKHEEEFPSETEKIQIPVHWHPKPCVHISSIGGPLTEEELLPLFSKYGPIASVSFENERHDAVLVRYELHLENGDELLAQVREATNSTKLGDKTLIVEPFRPDSLLFVGNLTPGIDDTALQAMFEPHGKIERAFVLRNAEGQSKCYGFVEYGLKSQAMTAKAVMGNINMDGRVLRVEWSDCKKVEDMFSTVLFVDRIPREGLQIEGALKSVFGKYGKIRDSHLAIGTGNQIRGFAFIDFYLSSTADKAHQALDGYNFEGSSIRVSFANPSKSAQSYKFRYGAQAGQGSSGRGAAGGSGVLSGPPSRGPSSRGPSPRVPTPMPLLPSRFMGPARPGMLGLGIGMQFGRGSFDRGTFHGSGRGMLGPAGRASLLMGSMGPRPGSAVIENSLHKLPFGQGTVSITPSAIVQVATAQARAREEEAKARAEAAKHGGSRSFSVGDSTSINHYQKLQQLQHQNYRQQQQANAYDQQYKQADLYSHQHASIAHHQASLHPQQQAWNQLQQQHSHQNVQHQRMQYHNASSQTFSQQHHVDQNTQNDIYYQQASQQAQQHGYASQYGQHQGYHQATQLYGQQVVQQTGEQYQQSTHQSQAAAYPQQTYGEQYAQQQQGAQGYNVAAPFEASAGLDAAQQQAYSAYYQQQAQAQAQAVTNPEAGQGAATAATPATQQNYEAQWAAYYASQAAYQQQAATTDVGQKRSADQMEQNQAAYNYAGYPQQGAGAYQQQQQAQQVSTESAAAYQQQAAYAAAAYQQQGAAGYQQAAATASYPVSGQTGYEQSSAAAADVAYQQPAAAFQGQAAVYDYTKRPRF